MVAFETQTVLLGFAMQDFSLNPGMVLWDDPRVYSLASPGPAWVPPYEALFWLQPGTFHDRFCASPPLAFGWGVAASLPRRASAGGSGPLLGPSQTSRVLALSIGPICLLSPLHASFTAKGVR